MEGWGLVAPIGRNTHTGNGWTVSIWTCDDDPLMDKMCWPATATDWMYSRAPTFMCLCFCWYDDCLTLLLSSHHGRGHIPLGIAVSEYSGTMSDAWCRLSLSIYGIFRATLSVPPVILTTNMLVARPSSQFTHSLPKKNQCALATESDQQSWQLVPFGVMVGGGGDGAIRVIRHSFPQFRVVQFSISWILIHLSTNKSLSPIIDIDNVYVCAARWCEYDSTIAAATTV